MIDIHLFAGSTTSLEKLYFQPLIRGISAERTSWDARNGMIRYFRGVSLLRLNAFPSFPNAKIFQKYTDFPSSARKKISTADNGNVIITDALKAATLRLERSRCIRP